MKMRPHASNKQPLLPWQRVLRPLKRAFFASPPIDELLQLTIFDDLRPIPIFKILALK